MSAEIKFGTDGWRGVIADDYTFENVRRVAGAIAAYVLKHEDSRRGLVVGYDTRFGSRRFAELVAETVADAGIPVTLANDHTPTPAVSLAVRRQGAAGGVVITSSHNPWNWNGVKYKASYGGSGTPPILARIEAELAAGSMPKGAKAPITEADLKAPYVEAIKKFVDFERIRRAGFRFAVDSMYGAGRGVLAGILQAQGMDVREIRAELNPLFPGINPEPIEPHIALLQETVRREGCHAGLATDGDADRIGAVAEDGSFVDAHKIFSILLRWVLERKGWPGDVVRAFNTTRMLDRIAAKHGRRLHETPVGFKHICILMLEREILIGGEESGSIAFPCHMPERDGILCGLLLAEIMAQEGKTLAQLVASLQQEFGPHYFGRRDLHLSEEVKQSAIARAGSGKVSGIGPYRILRTETVDGIKYFLDAPTEGKGAEAWVLLRASGTEPLLRVYAEAASPTLVEEILARSEELVRKGN
ncbi:MAG: phosphoglucomutase/phosphomannomutase family protein [Terriglobales bacterium]